MEELYWIDNGNERRKIATKEYLEQNKIPYDLTLKEKNARRYEGLAYAIHCNSYVNANKPVKVLDANGIKLIYLFGEKTWFDTQEELDEYRKDYWAEMSIINQKNKLKKEINAILDSMEIQDLEILLAKLS